MIANTKEMKEIQRQLKNSLQREFMLNEMFNGAVDSCAMDEVALSELRRLSQEPDLHEAEIVRLEREDIMSNPYLSNINVPNVSSGNYKLSKRRLIRPGVITKIGPTIRNQKTMIQSSGYFVCDRPLRFPGLVEGDSTTPWMTVEPFEINTFAPFIEEATGDVLLIGCGLGYAAYMLSRKDDVRSITVVDNNQDILNLFETHILPQFENKNKITTVKSDGLEYLRTTDLSIFDHVNVDIWHDTVDMIFPYLRCLEIERANQNVKFSYWLEEELKESIQKAILVAASREDMVVGKKWQKIQFEPSANIYMNNFLADKIGEDVVRNTLISNLDDLYNLVSIPDLRGFLFEWYANNLETVEKSESVDLSIVKSFIGKRTNQEQMTAFLKAKK